MKSKLIFLLVGFLAGLGAGIFIWQNLVTKPVTLENQQLHAEAGKVVALAEENARLVNERVDPAELKRLREGQAELVRLRGQTTQLRREAQEANSAAARAQVAAQAAAAAAATPPPAPTNAVPTTAYTASATFRVGWRTAAATGGWVLPSGKRGFVILMPAEAGDGTVSIRSLVFQVPEALLTAAGLDGLKAEGNAANGGAALTTEQLQVLTSSYRKKEGVELMSAPQISVASGQSAQVSVADSGSTIAVTPTIMAENQGVEIAVNAQLNLPRATPGP